MSLCDERDENAWIIGVFEDSSDADAHVDGKRS